MKQFSKPNRNLLFLFICILQFAALIFSACQSEIMPKDINQSESEAAESIFPSSAPSHAKAETIPGPQILSPTPSPSSSPTPEPTETAAEKTILKPPDSNGIVWMIEPSFEYEIINYCTYCKSDSIDVNDKQSVGKTLEKSERDNGIVWLCHGHGYSVDSFFFDEKKGCFLIYSTSAGYESLNWYSPEEFINQTYYNIAKESELLYKTCLFAIRKIDTEKIKIYDSTKEEAINCNIYDFNMMDYRGYILFDLSDAYLEKYALAYGSEFLSDFIYDYTSKGNFNYSDTENFLEMKLWGKWGVLDKQGKTAIPFVFEKIEFINDTYAFGKIDGKYGIFHVKNSMITEKERRETP